jgi:hypothetical protein
MKFGVVAIQTEVIARGVKNYTKGHTHFCDDASRLKLGIEEASRIMDTCIRSF